MCYDTGVGWFAVTNSHLLMSTAGSLESCLSLKWNLVLEKEKPL